MRRAGYERPQAVENARSISLPRSGLGVHVQCPFGDQCLVQVLES